jgi:hypothetical protein
MMMICKGFVRSGRGLILRYYPGIRLEGLKKNTNSIRMTGRRVLNPGPPEYEAGVVTTRPRRSVKVDFTPCHSTRG